MLKIQYPVRMEGRGEGGADDLYFWNENITEIIFHHNHSREFLCMRAHIYTHTHRESKLDGYAITIIIRSKCQTAGNRHSHECLKCLTITFICLF